MKNEVRFAAAGNGKTYSICKEAIQLATETKKHILLVSYTHEGVRSLENEYRNQNCGVVDKNVVIKTWYSFLLSDLIKPYQCLLKLKCKKYRDEIDFAVPENFIKSIAFYQDEKPEKWFSGKHIQYYVNSAHDIVKDNVSSLSTCCVDHSEGKVVMRLEEIYSHIYFDELQDYAGWDLEIFSHLFRSSIRIKCVGDHKQATFRTNNSPKNKQYRDQKIRDYFQLHERKGLCCISYANTTRRFNREICEYVNTIHNDMESQICPSDEDVEFETENTGVFLIDNEYIENYCNYYKPTILRYRCDSQMLFNHNCRVFNYGNSKGATFERVVIVPIGTVLPFINEQKKISSDGTRSKFFVACTRTRHSIVFAMQKPKENERFKPTEIRLGDMVLPAYKYSNK